MLTVWLLIISSAGLVYNLLMLVLTVWLLIIGGCSAGLQSVDARVDGLVVDNKEGAAPVRLLIIRRVLGAAPVYNLLMC